MSESVVLGVRFPRRSPTAYSNCHQISLAPLAAVRQGCYQWRSKSIEPFNGWFKGIFEWGVKRPVEGVPRSHLLALGAMVISQVALRYQHERGLPLGHGIKPLLSAV